MALSVPIIKNTNTDNWRGPEGALSVVYSSDLNKNTPENHHYSIRTKDYRYIVYNTGQEELYDKNSDPKERNNLIFDESHTETANMRALIKNITYPMVPQGITLIEDN